MLVGHLLDVPMTFVTLVIEADDAVIHGLCAFENNLVATDKSFCGASPASFGSP